MFDEGPKTKTEDEEHCEKSRDRRWEKGRIRRRGLAGGSVQGYTRSEGRRLSVQRAQRRKSEPATTAVPASTIMPMYEPPCEWRIAPAAGLPHSALHVR